MASAVITRLHQIMLANVTHTVYGTNRVCESEHDHSFNETKTLYYSNNDRNVAGPHWGLFYHEDMVVESVIQCNGNLFYVCSTLYMYENETLIGVRALIVDMTMDTGRIIERTYRYNTYVGSHFAIHYYRYENNTENIPPWQERICAAAWKKAKSLMN